MSRQRKGTFNIPVLVTLLGFAFVHVFLLFEPFAHYSWVFDSELAAQFGDFIGGYVGSLFILASVVLLYVTLRNQREAFTRQQFENRFFELLKAHRDNASEIHLKEKTGRRVFVVLVREFDEVLRLLNEVLADQALTFQPEERIGIAYLAFYYGVGEHSDIALQNALRAYPEGLVFALINKLKGNQACVKVAKGWCHDPFDGHQSRLGHYFRHLYQSVNYVDDDTTLTGDEKYGFVKTLRAQLTNHEQVLLFYNSLSILGRVWKTEGLMTRYRLIKNIPKGFIKEKDPKDVYPKLKFEWEE